MPRLRTFIVEDSPVIRASLISALEELVPLQVVGTAEDEATAVRWLADPQHGCDLVIIDIFLRSGTGLGVLHALRASGRQVERIVLSNHASDEMRRHCLALDASRVFDKSGEIEDLVRHCLLLAAAPDGGPQPAPAS